MVLRKLQSKRLRHTQRARTWQTSPVHALYTPLPFHPWHSLASFRYFCSSTHPRPKMLFCFFWDPAHLSVSPDCRNRKLQAGLRPLKCIFSGVWGTDQDQCASKHSLIKRCLQDWVKGQPPRQEEESELSWSFLIRMLIRFGDSLPSEHHLVLITSLGALSLTVSPPKLGLQHHHITSHFLGKTGVSLKPL